MTVANSAPRRVIDTHLHVWKVDAPWMAWLDERPSSWDVVRRDFDFDELLTCLDSVGVADLMLVQAGTDIRETQELLRLAAGETRVRGVVGWASLRDPATTARHIDSLLNSPGGDLLKGIRNNHRWKPDGDVLATREVIAACRVVKEQGLRLDVHVEDDRDLPLVLAVAESIPELTLIVDHLGKPRIAEGRYFNDWRGWMQRLSELPNVYVKYSGWSTFLPRVDASDVAQYVASTIEMFGAFRVMYGGNWPVALVTDSYCATYEATLQAVEHCSDAELEHIFHRTATNCYDLADREPTCESR